MCFAFTQNLINLCDSRSFHLYLLLFKFAHVLSQFKILHERVVQERAR